MGDRCRACGVRKRMPQKRGLCWACYHTPGVRAAHPSVAVSTTPAARGEVDTGGMTASELDAFVAEGLRPENLPAWWHTSAGAGVESGEPGRSAAAKMGWRTRRGVPPSSRPGTGA